jgi:hypothetical protein
MFYDKTAFAENCRIIADQCDQKNNMQCHAKINQVKEIKLC